MVTDLLKTSFEWLNTEGYDHFTIEDPSGWDQDNFQNSFYSEKISEAEFFNRVMRSTIRLEE